MEREFERGERMNKKKGMQDNDKKQHDGVNLSWEIERDGSQTAVVS